MKIIIIGSGWYGCYVAYLLQNKHEVLLVEKNNEIFQESSYYNQNRLHLGYHYPRNKNTRILCKKYFKKFKDTFKTSREIKNNFYLISNESLLDYETYKTIYEAENYKQNVLKNNNFKNIDGDIFDVCEEVIDSSKSKEFFENNLNCKLMLNSKVEKICLDGKPKVYLNDNCLESDLIIDCTYNFLNQSKKKYIYEKTVSFLYKKTNIINFNALTIMDGDFCSLYPRNIDSNIYSLTDVEFSPVLISNEIKDIKNFDIKNYNLIDTKNKMEEKIMKYYPEFKINFEYVDYFLANKTKLISNNDTRECNIEFIDKKLITVNCGKIIGIFEVENFLENLNLI